MDMLSFFLNDPVILILGLLGIGLVTTATLLSRSQKSVKHSARDPYLRKDRQVF